MKPKRIISLLVAVCMVVAMLPVGALTAFADTTQPTIISNGVVYTLDSSNNTATVTGYDSQSFPSDGKIEISEKVTDSSNNQYTVTSIGYKAFENCVKLISVEIPGSVTSINGYAFYCCTKLTSVEIPGSVTEIGEYAFAACTSLTSVTIPGSVVSIGKHVFAGCSLSTVSYTGTHTQWADLKFDTTMKTLMQQVEPAAVTIDDDESCSVDDKVNLTATVAKNSNGTKAVLKVTDTDDIIEELTSNNQKVSDGYEVTLSDDNTSIPLEMAFKGIGTCTFTIEAKTNDNRIVDTKSVKITVNPCVRKVTVENLNNIEINSDLGTLQDNTLEVEFNTPMELSAGKNVTLTVENPNTVEYTYKWTVDGEESTDTSCTIKVPQSTKITLTCIKKLVKGDLEIDIPDGEYDGTAKKVTVSSAGGVSMGEDDYEVIYTKENGAATTTAPKDVGNYRVTVAIKKNDDHQGETIDAGVLTISPKIPSKEDFEVNLPDGIKENAETSQKQAMARVKSGNPLNEDGVTIDYSYRKVTNDGSKAVVSAPTDAGKYEYVATITIVPTNANISNGEVSWPFTIEPEEKIKIADALVKVNGKESKPDEDGYIAAKEGDEIIVTFDKTTLSDAQVFDQWTITPASVLNAVDPKSETISFTMPAEEVSIKAMTRDATIEDDGPGVLGTAAMIGVGVAGTAVLGYQSYMIGTELYLDYVLPAGAAIPNNTTELAKLLWTDAGKPAPAAVLVADATDEQKALTWAVENQLISADKAADASVTRWEVIQTWNKEQEMKKV